MECHELPQEEKGFFPAISGFEFEPYLSKNLPNDLIFELKNNTTREITEEEIEEKGIMSGKPVRRTELIVTEKSVNFYLTFFYRLMMRSV